MNWANPDYTGASAKEYTDRYTNRPEDAGNIEGIQGLLGRIGLIPGVGEPADWANSLIYAAQGDAKNAALYASGLGLMGSMKLFRGLPEWYRGSVKGGKWYGGDLATEAGRKKGIFATKDKKYAEEYMQTDEAGSRLMEFRIPDKEAAKYSGDAHDFIKGGIPKKYLHKVHKPRYSQWDRKWFYNKSDDVVDELK